MSDTCRLFPPFGDPWPSCLLPSHLFGSNCCILTCIQVFQEAGKVVWYSYLFQNFPQFLVIHTVKGFGIVNKAEIDVFLELSCFFHDPADVANFERVTGRKARGLQMEEIACKCQTFLSLLSGRRKQTSNIFFLLYTNLKRGFS